MRRGIVLVLSMSLLGGCWFQSGDRPRLTKSAKSRIDKAIASTAPPALLADRAWLKCVGECGPERADLLGAVSQVNRKVNAAVPANARVSEAYQVSPNELTNAAGILSFAIREAAHGCDHVRFFARRFAVTAESVLAQHRTPMPADLSVQGLKPCHRTP